MQSELAGLLGAANVEEWISWRRRSLGKKEDKHDAHSHHAWKETLVGLFTRMLLPPWRSQTTHCHTSMLGTKRARGKLKFD